MEGDPEKTRDRQIGEYLLAHEGLSGFVVASEKPDLDCHIGDKVIGLELTELAPANSRSRRPGIERVMRRCQELHSDRGYPVVRCFVNFDPTFSIKKIDADKYAESLIRSLSPSIRQFSLKTDELRVDDGLPDGLLNVTIRSPISRVRQTIYSNPFVVGHEILSIQDITECVNRKESLLQNYRPYLHEYWLAIHFGHLPAENWFIGPAPNLLDEFPIESKFERVYIMTPLIAGGVYRIR